ncbi:MAG TPA: phosphomannomutase [Alphaproteobacteria bacterium]|nr:phosphomannomutase [Alphaproteobacteria bacterium]
MTSYHINPAILRAYDIRGEFGKTLFQLDAYFIAKAFATKVIRKTGNKNPTIAMAYDGRLSSPELQAQVQKGLMSAGVNVVNVGLGPSPKLYFAVRSMELDGGIMVTASHNPPKDNGFKMMYEKAPLFGAEIKELGNMAASGDLIDDIKHGSVEKKDIEGKYIEKLLTAFEGGLLNSKNLKDLKIVWDTANAAASEVTKKLVKKLPNENIIINGDIDGNFPAHHPDPTLAENLQQLIAEVKKHKADLGIAFDGDGDRVGAVDGQGRIIWGDQLMTLYAEDVLENNSGAEIIADVKASQSFFDAVEKLGGKPLMWKTGHSYIKNKLAETGAPLAGEMSGHIFFADRYYGYDDAVYAALRLINYFVKNNIKPVAAVDKLPKTYASKEYRVPVAEAIKEGIVKEIRAQVMASKAKVIEVDGIRVIEGGGWWLLRSSNTQSVLTIRAESNSESELQKLITKINMLLKPYHVSLSDDAGH